MLAKGYGELTQKADRQIVVSVTLLQEFGRLP